MIEVKERNTEISLGHFNIQETSILSIKQVENDGVANTQRNMILDFIKNNKDVCIREIAEVTNIQKSSVSPRLNELRKRFKVKHNGQKVYKGKLVMTWRENENDKL